MEDDRNSWMLQQWRLEMNARSLRLLTYLGVLVLLYFQPISYLQHEPHADIALQQSSSRDNHAVSLSHAFFNDEATKNFNFRILSEAVMDDPAMALAISNILVSGNITKPRISRLLHEQYNSLMDRRELNESHVPSQIEIYAFDSGGLANGVWVAMLEKKSHYRIPVIHINHAYFDIIERSARLQEAIHRIAQEMWPNVATVEYHHTTQTAEIIVDLGEVSWDAGVIHICNNYGGILIETLYEKIPYLHAVIIQVFGEVLDIYGHNQTMHLYEVEADHDTVEKINFNTLGHAAAVETIFKPWCHSQLRIRS